ncbi:MAG: peptide chain release factor N(5)-glutamine methyltransferase [Pseudomonadota bacterium]
MIPKTFGDAQSLGFRRLRAANIPDPANDARWLLADAAELRRDQLLLCSSEPIPAQVWDRFEAAIAQRVARVPVSIITGKKEFYGRSFAVGPSVLSPRPETEDLIALALQEPYHHVLDLGVGSGCILLTLVAEASDLCIGFGTDISRDAICVAMENREALGLSGPVELRQGSWFEAVPERKLSSFDLVVSNPPYVSADAYERLAPELFYEPKIALTPGGDGLAAYRVIAREAPSYLKKGGRLLVEIGFDQAAAVCALFAEAGLDDIRVHPDMDGKDRVVAAQARG